MTKAPIDAEEPESAVRIEWELQCIPRAPHAVVVDDDLDPIAVPRRGDPYPLRPGVLRHVPEQLANGAMEHDAEVLADRILGQASLESSVDVVLRPDLVDESLESDGEPQRMEGRGPEREDERADAPDGPIHDRDELPHRVGRLVFGSGSTHRGEPKSQGCEVLPDLVVESLGDAPSLQLLRNGEVGRQDLEVPIVVVQQSGNAPLLCIHDAGRYGRDSSFRFPHPLPWPRPAILFRSSGENQMTNPNLCVPPFGGIAWGSLAMAFLPTLEYAGPAWGPKRQRTLNKLVVALLAAMPHFGSAAYAVVPLVSVSPRDPWLRVVDAETAATLASETPIVLQGSVVTGATGLARHPGTGTLYALLRVAGRANPDLVTLNEASGIATRVGGTSQKFSSLAFDDQGTLYAVTGDGATQPESLFTLDPANASSTLVATLGNGSDGEAIGFSETDGLLYHASGIGAPNDPVDGEILEKIDPQGPSVTNVHLSGYDYEELSVIASAGDGFYAADLGSSLVDEPHMLHIGLGGFVTLVGDLDHVSKGLAPLAACADGEDNDGDGLTDFIGGDPGCDDPADADERSSALPCDNGIDDDGDGWIDHAPEGGDPGCGSPASPLEDPACQDGVDNDGQIGTDFDGGASILGAGNEDPSGPDPQCTAPWVNREGRLKTVACGLGPEALPALAGLLGLRRRSRAGRGHVSGA